MTKKRAKKKQKPRLTPKTQNGIMIANLMKKEGIKGNYKDYVVLSPQGILHWNGTFRLTRSDNGEDLEMPAIAILHKRELHSIVGPEIGRLFWCKNGSRVMATL